MPPLYVVQQNAKIRIENRQVTVELDGTELSSIPIGQVSQVVLFGNIGLTTPAIGALLLAEIEVVFLTENGAYKGRLVGSVTPHVLLRRVQYQRTVEAQYVLQTARGLVSAKLLHLHTLLVRHNREQPDAVVEAAAAQIKASLTRVEQMNSLAELLGLEGTSSRAYFGGYRRLFGPEWHFGDRNRRPPQDPINVLLSLGYTLLMQTTLGAVQVVGLDPYAGFLHDVAYNRPALALDLLEEFRPVIDGLILWCCHGGQITPADFSPGPAERPVILSEAGIHRYIQAFEQRLERRFTHPQRGIQMPLRQCILEQARQIANRIQNNDPGYQGMGWR
jgi:CRISPR-associated protein Cas1